MIDVTVTHAVDNFHRVLNKVERGETVRIRKHGRATAEIRRAVGISGREFAERLSRVRFTAKESAELRRAMKASSKVFGYAGGR